MSILISDLEEGAIIEAAPLMGHLCDEQVVLMVGKKSDNETIVHASYFGVNIGEAYVTLVDGKEEWVWV